MKIFILRNVSVNRLLDKELEQLKDAGIEFAITDNNGPFGIDNVSLPYASNMNTIVFMWEDYYVEDKEDWFDKINNCAEVVGNVIKNIFKFYSEAVPRAMDEWKHLCNQLKHMNAHQTMKYDISLFRFI